MENGNGVEIWFEPSAKIPEWLKLQAGSFEAVDRALNGRTFSAIRLRGGQAGFTWDNSVTVLRPELKIWWTAFRGDAAIAILDFDGNIIGRNRRLCKLCATLTGEMISCQVNVKDHSARDVTYRCANDECGYTYEFKPI